MVHLPGVARLHHQADLRAGLLPDEVVVHCRGEEERGDGRQLGRPVSPAEERKLVDVIRRTFAGVFPTALFEDQLVSVYAKHLSEAEAKELLRFYATPVGSKAIRLAAVLTREGAAIGQRLAQSRQAEFAQRLRDELAREFSP